MQDWDMAVEEFHFREDGFQIRCKIAARNLFLAEVTARFLKVQRLGYSEVGDTANRSTAIACWALE
jgi:hypothetical protein